MLRSECAEFRRYIVVCAAICALCLSLKLQNWLYPRAEGDERISWELARNWLQTGRYSLQGTGLLEALHLPPEMYDKPLFHHPPLLPALLVPFVYFSSPHAAILIPWIAHLLAIMGVAMLCWIWRRRSWDATHPLLWLPVLATALDPLLAFCSRKLWPDPLIGGFACMVMGLCAVAANRRSIGLAIAAGICVALAGQAKLVGLAVLPPAMLFVWFLSPRDPAIRRRLLAALVVPAVMLTLPWLVVFHREYNCLLPEWTAASPSLIASNEHIRRAIGRPWYYFATESVLVAPVVLIVFTAYAFRGRRVLLSPRLLIPLIWTVFLWLVLTYLVLHGHCKHLRYLTPLTPGLYAMLAALLGTLASRRSWLPFAVTIAIAYGAVHSGFYLWAGEFDEIVSLPEALASRLING